MKTTILLILLLCCFDLHGQWNQINSPTNKTLHSITFPDSITGYIVGANMVVLKTTDSGMTWSLIYSVTQNAHYFRGLSFINDSVGFTSGYVGVVGDKLFKTTNGGYDWDSITVGERYSFQGVDFINDSTGFLYGEQLDNSLTQWNAVILKTTNQGNLWHQVYSSGDGIIYALKFLNNNYGFAVGWDYPNGLILKTTNGGNNWVQKNVGSPITLRSVCVLDSLNIIASSDGYTGTIIKSSDAGEHWIILISGLTNSQLENIQFNLPNQGNVISSDGEIFFSGDSGYNWTRSWMGNASLTDMYFINDSTGFVVGTQGTILNTVNGGITNVGGEKKFGKQPGGFILSQNYPNPFNPITTIKYSLPTVSKIKLEVYDVLGNNVVNLVNEEQQSGNYELKFDGNELPSGVYFYQLKTGEFISTKKMILLK